MNLDGVLNGGESPASIKRRRTIKACDVCRSRKLKCDGNDPCQRCESSKAPCRYTYVEKRKKPTPKITKANAIQNLDQRMRSLEELMTSLIKRLDPELAVSSMKTTAAASEQGAETSSRSDVMREELSPSTQNEYSSHSEEESEDGEAGRCDMDSSTTTTRNSTKIIKQDDQKFFGSQSSFSVLSPRGLQWLSKKADDPTIQSKFFAIPRKFNAIVGHFLPKWTEYYDASGLVPLPSKEVVDGLLDSYSSVIGPSFFITRDELNELFDIHYGIEKPSNTKSSTRPSSYAHSKKLSNSALLIMYGVISLGALFQVDRLDVPDDDPKLKVLKDMHNRYLDMAIYYYHKVTVFCEDIKTVQGLLVLVLHTLYSPPPQLSLMLVATAVRYAQELGLHRVENLVGLSEEDVERRRRIWYHVYVFDQDCCLRLGQPPLISDVDVTHVLPNFRITISGKNVSKEIIELLDSPTFDISNPIYRKLMTDLYPSTQPNLESDSIRMLIVSFFTEYIRFSSHAYSTLFCVNSQVGKSSDEIMETIEGLNNELDVITNNIPTNFKPGLTLTEDILKIPENHDVILVHLQYYLERMLINRMAFKRAWMNDGLVSIDVDSETSPKQKKFMMSCLASARSIIKLFIQMKKFSPLFFYYASFYYFSSFSTLFTCLIDDPEAPTTKDDLLLLKEGSLSFLEKMAQYAARHDDKLTYNAASYFLKFFLKIAISVYNNYNSVKIDTTALDNEINLHDKILTFNAETERENFMPDGLGEKPTGSDIFTSQQPLPQQPSKQQGNLPQTFTFTNPSHPRTHTVQASSSISNGFSEFPFQGEQLLQQQQQQSTPVRNQNSINTLTEPNYDLDGQFGLDDAGFGEMNSNTMMQHLFAFPNIYVNLNDLQTLDPTSTENNFNF